MIRVKGRTAHHRQNFPGSWIHRHNRSRLSFQRLFRCNLEIEINRQPQLVTGLCRSLIEAPNFFSPAVYNGAPRAILAHQNLVVLQFDARLADDVAASIAAARASAHNGARVIVFGSFVTVGAAGVVNDSTAPNAVPADGESIEALLIQIEDDALRAREFYKLNRRKPNWSRADDEYVAFHGWLHLKSSARLDIASLVIVAVEEKVTMREGELSGEHIWLRQSVTYTHEGQTRTLEIALPIRPDTPPEEIARLLAQARPVILRE
jgi:hypothetical protein